MTLTRRMMNSVALVVLGAGLASATTITQTGTIPVQPTDVTHAGTTQTFNYFRNVGGITGLDILDSVTISFSVNETVTSLTFENNDVSSQNFSFVTTAGFSLGGTAPTADKTALKTGLPTIGSPITMYSVGDGTSNQTIAGGKGTTLVYLGGPQSPTVDPSLIGLLGLNNPLNFATSVTHSTGAALTAYDTTGTFTFDYATSTGSTFFGGGGNITAHQGTTTNGAYTVAYDYHTSQATGTPEPASMILMGSALLGLGLFRKKFKA